MATAIFAAGCFWGVQYYFDQIPGVINTEVGYTGGHTTDPNYEAVCSHTTGHAEAVKVEYTESQVSYDELIIHFLRMHNPTQLNRQGPDVGDSYRSAIFYANELEKNTAEALIEQAQLSINDRIVTEVKPVGPFYRAEEYHQKYTERTGRGICHIAYQPIS
ncbi:MAG: hypothetical protein NVS1B7_5480 [Candidatus Saccharimonadales bacterium]